ncbi:Hint domain-containing protein [Pseudooceanicola onchidii]|uniref:Hint domain-containing protein n=1 Tax=Pseudooceanicola onchidii TaxID=2562279 RepID=UPI0010A9A29D|nr:Hint domain-containing protein [Pseudooceanicola onchidii]
MSKFEAYEPKGGNGQIEGAEARRVGKRGAIACFVAGTKILTMEGQRPVEQLVPGDRVMTRDHGLQSLRWIGCRHVDGSEIKEFDSVRPIRIAAGALGNGMPVRDLLVSPEHRVMVSGDKVAELIGEDEALIAAKYLVGRDGITVEKVEAVIYYHLMFDDHELVMSEGTWTESFLPGLSALNGMDVEAVEELYAIYPELRLLPTPFKPARASMDPVIAKMLSADAGLLVKNDA